MSTDAPPYHHRCWLFEAFTGIYLDDPFPLWSAGHKVHDSENLSDTFPLCISLSKTSSAWRCRQFFWMTYIFYAFNGLNLHFQMQPTTAAKLYLQRLSNMFPAPCGDIIYRAMWFLTQFSLMGSKVKGVWCWFTL